ncbi:MAG: GTP-binding protein, partial [Alphaproteobacteria bacterium]|nr:GTP-binding protein [Alphaproteobacteria bacterium]
MSETQTGTNQTGAEQRIPVTVLTGFLGSGKTTLLNKLLRRPELADTAVIINEFGEIGLDHLLVEKSSEDGMVTLNSGCLCCAVRTDLVLSLKSLLDRRDAGTLKPFRRIAIETSGLAEPGPILYTLAADPELEARLGFDSVATVVDAVAGAATLARHPEAGGQIAVADRLLISKTDLAPPPAALLDRL